MIDQPFVVENKPGGAGRIADVVVADNAGSGLDLRFSSAVV